MIFIIGDVIFFVFLLVVGVLVGVFLMIEIVLIGIDILLVVIGVFCGCVIGFMVFCLEIVFLFIYNLNEFFCKLNLVKVDWLNCVNNVFIFFNCMLIFLVF